MPRTPKGHKRPADVISNAVRVMQIATDEADEPDADDRSIAASLLGKAGGMARAKSLTSSERIAIAKKGATVRWKMKPKQKGR